MVPAVATKGDAIAILQLEKITTEVQELQSEIARLNSLLSDRIKKHEILKSSIINSMKRNDVYESGNYGYEARKIDWLRTLAKQFRSAIEDGQ